MLLCVTVVHVDHVIIEPCAPAQASEKILDHAVFPFLFFEGRDSSNDNGWLQVAASVACWCTKRWSVGGRTVKKSPAADLSGSRKSWLRCCGAEPRQPVMSV